MGLRASIDWKYAGVEVRQHVPDHLENDIARVGVGKAEPVALEDGHSYWVSHGRYVPFFESNQGAEKFRDFERMVSELTDRFFRNAQPEINRQHNAADISYLMERYDAAPLSGSERQTVGARLVGAMINRMGRLAQAIIEKRRTGIVPDILDIERDMPIEAMEAQLSRYYQRLMQDTDLVSQVRRNQGMRILAMDVDSGSQSPRFDYDGVLHEMIQEVGKASAFKPDHDQAARHAPSPDPTSKEERALDRSENLISQGRVNKIGNAMRCVDDITRLLDKISTHDPQLLQSPTGALLKDMGDAAKALLGLKKGDVKNYIAAEVLYESRQKDLNRLYFQSINKSEITNQSLVIVQKGFDLIKDMVTTRLACNEIYWPRGEEPKTIAPTPPKGEDMRYGDPRARMAKFALAAEAQLQKLEGRWTNRVASAPDSNPISK